MGKPGERLAAADTQEIVLDIRPRESGLSGHKHTDRTWWGRAASARGRFPDVEPVLKQRGLHPVDVALPDAFRMHASASGRADVQPLAGVNESVDVSRAERSHPQVLGGLIAPALHVLKQGP